MTPTEACEALNNFEQPIECTNTAVQTLGVVLCGIKDDGLKVIPDDSESPAPFLVSIVEDGGLSQLENLENGIGLITDAAITNPATNGSIISYLRGLLTQAATAITNLVSIVTNTGTVATNSTTIVTRTNSLGQKAMGASMPVVIASDQSAIKSKDAGLAYETLRGVGGTFIPFNTSDLTTPQPVSQAPASGMLLVITDIFISTDTAMLLTFTEETSGDEVLRQYMAANTSVQVTPRGKLILSAVDKRLVCQASVSGNVSIQTLCYTEA